MDEVLDQPDHLKAVSRRENDGADEGSVSGMFSRERTAPAALRWILVFALMVITVALVVGLVAEWRRISDDTIFTALGTFQRSTPGPTITPVLDVWRAVPFLAILVLVIASLAAAWLWGLRGSNSFSAPRLRSRRPLAFFTIASGVAGVVLLVVAGKWSNAAGQFTGGTLTSTTAFANVFREVAACF